MTRDECMKQALARIGHRGSHWPAVALRGFALDAMAPFIRRDETMVDGKATSEEIDIETGEKRTVEVQLHPQRLVAPYNYGINEVLWLEREIRRRAGL